MGELSGPWIATASSCGLTFPLPRASSSPIVFSSRFQWLYYGHWWWYPGHDLTVWTAGWPKALAFLGLCLLHHRGHGLHLVSLSAGAYGWLAGLWQEGVRFY